MKRVAYGTSLTAAWPRALPHAIGWCAIPGGNSRDGLDHFDAVAEQRPDVLFLEWSVNDCMECVGITPAASALYAAEMIERAHAAGCRRVLLMTMNGLYVGLPDLAARAAANPAKRRCPIEPYYDAYRDLAARLGLGLVDAKRAWDALDPTEVAQLIPDGVHPTEEGYRRVLAPLVTAALIR